MDRRGRNGEPMDDEVVTYADPAPVRGTTLKDLLARRRGGGQSNQAAGNQSRPADDFDRFFDVPYVEAPQSGIEEDAGSRAQLRSDLRWFATEGNAMVPRVSEATEAYQPAPQVVSLDGMSLRDRVAANRRRITARATKTQPQANTERIESSSEDDDGGRPHRITTGEGGELPHPPPRNTRGGASAINALDALGESAPRRGTRALSSLVDALPNDLSQQPNSRRGPNQQQMSASQQAAPPQPSSANKALPPRGSFISIDELIASTPMPRPGGGSGSTRRTSGRSSGFGLSQQSAADTPQRKWNSVGEAERALDAVAEASKTAGDSRWFQDASRGRNANSRRQQPCPALVEAEDRLSRAHERWRSGGSPPSLTVKIVAVCPPRWGVSSVRCTVTSVAASATNLTERGIREGCVVDLSIGPAVRRDLALPVDGFLSLAAPIIIMPPVAPPSVATLLSTYTIAVTSNTSEAEAPQQAFRYPGLGGTPSKSGLFVSDSGLIPPASAAPSQSGPTSGGPRFPVGPGDEWSIPPDVLSTIITQNGPPLLSAPNPDLPVPMDLDA